VSGLQFDSSWDHRIENKLATNGWESNLPNFEYLQNWFPRSVLVQFAAVLQAIEQHETIRDFLRVILSDLVRAVSLQDPGDLRIRRRKEPRANYPLIPMMINGVAAKASTIVRAYSTQKPRGRQHAFLADSRVDLRLILGQTGAPDLLDAAITSPPYATALPYVDTQRLSLALLGLLQAADVMALDSQLVGTREVTQRHRERLEREIVGAQGIPDGVRTLCNRMLKAVGSSATDGFRRRNMPALVLQYFQGMANALSSVAQVVKPGGHFVLVVGRNRTVLGGEEFTVDTPKHLIDTGNMTGWSRESQLELETYQRFDVHQRNSIRTESMVILRRN
jgi:site-specific DNA-methyltransferase (cytosine-N4-specific)